MFSCPVSKVIWGVIEVCLHQTTRPMSYEQYWAWIEGALPGGESMYAFGLAAICWSILKTRNSICFDKKVLKNLVEILYNACAFMRYWADIYSEPTPKVIEEGVELMLRMAAKLLSKKARRPDRYLMIEDEKASADDEDAAG
jgi:hypothetical protein